MSLLTTIRDKMEKWTRNQMIKLVSVPCVTQQQVLPRRKKDHSKDGVLSTKGVTFNKVMYLIFYSYIAFII